MSNLNLLDGISRGMRTAILCWSSPSNHYINIADVIRGWGYEIILGYDFMFGCRLGTQDRECFYEVSGGDHIKT
ncbi:hypothetical protein AKJ16_DCAP12356 [Drosera capensis]